MMMKMRWMMIKLKGSYKQPKYGNKKVTVDGITFDSVKEFNRYAELNMLQRGGVIKDLELQKKFILIPSQKIDGKVVERECSYIADFVYTDVKSWERIVEDVKGYRDPSSAAYAKFVIKRKLMLKEYGIKIVEV
jgi:hypothetical protein